MTDYGDRLLGCVDRPGTGGGHHKLGVRARKMPKCAARPRPHSIQGDPVLVGHDSGDEGVTVPRVFPRLSCTLTSPSDGDGHELGLPHHEFSLYDRLDSLYARVHDLFNQS